MQAIGFKRMTITVLDNTTNSFVIEGTKDKGATKIAKISGLSAEPTKTFGSDIAYYTSRRGVGDVKMEMEAIDIPFEVLKVILGYKDNNGITFVGEDTESPEVSVLLEAPATGGKNAYLGFFKGTFSMDDFELKSKEEKNEGLDSQKLAFAAQPGDEGDAKGQYVGWAFDEKTEAIAGDAKKLADLLKVKKG
ncbi:major tail protein [Streptococcus phage Javan126]|uniref:major tail protein n=1 Tax=Streptococcus dysgalactiae TaxID=1334 RepID=UPI000824201B|nr:major tail protein [Streptococcus dysgalactiae]QBX14316.1 major tail protein [Streptococcus phage Javan133]QBX23357.1 major tail protein [Streptococcus phage Javan126]QBX23853.1 major tail protein [Streptococcus phage Javan164]OCW99966.1 phage tail protein [Streptococcus dysgalactiae subsp. equisimilis]OCX02223.1 phage tail protein [Streptococcus dysgalactiae subsp. equisimilis]